MVILHLVIMERISAIGLRHSRYHALKSPSMPNRAKMCRARCTGWRWSLSRSKAFS